MNMPSKFHQMIVGLIGRKMREKGYSIVAFDGDEYLFDGQKLNIPFVIKRHKPDIIGFKYDTREICVGEAKTREDLFSKRTREQLLDYSMAKSLTSGKNIEIIVGIPKSAEKDFSKILKGLDLDGKEYISLICLPEDLIEYGREN